MNRILKRKPTDINVFIIISRHVVTCFRVSEANEPLLMNEQPQQPHTSSFTHMQSCSCEHYCTHPLLTIVA